MFSVNYQSQTPIYRQLYDQVLKLTSLGVLSPGSKLPPVRALATELGINPNTVQKTYALLENDGYIMSAVGRGTFITDNLDTPTAILKQAEDEFRKAAETALQKGLTAERLAEIIKEVKK